MDELVLVEQCVNLINGPLIFLQLLHLSIPAYTKQIFESFVFCSVRHVFLRIAIYHRAIGGLGIAGAAGVTRPAGPSRTTDRFVDVLTSCHCLEINL